MENPKDSFGRIIQRGDLVTYGIRRHDGLSVAVAIVIDPKIRIDKNSKFEYPKIEIVTYRPTTNYGNYSIVMINPKDMILIGEESIPNSIVNQLKTHFDVSKENK